MVECHIPGVSAPQGVRNLVAGVVLVASLGAVVLRSKRVQTILRLREAKCLSQDHDKRVPTHYH